MLNKIKGFFSLSENTDHKDKIKYENKSNKKEETEYENMMVSAELETNKKNINKIFNKCKDLIIREFKITNNPKYSGLLVYIDAMIDTRIFEETIIHKLTAEKSEYSYSPDSIEYSKYLLGVNDNNIYKGLDKVVEAVLSGKIALFIDFIDEAIIININNPPSRSIDESPSESVLRGPRESFTESIATNIALIRKKIRSTNLKIETSKIGNETQTEIDIVYLSNIADIGIINEVKRRLNKINIDSVLDSNYIKEHICDVPVSNFPVVYTTEKPDVLAAKLLQGRVCILLDGTPVALSVPAFFMEFLITVEDQYLGIIPATINRWVRYTSFLISITTPGIYVAITTFHQELIPTPLLVTFISARSGVPFPGLFEAVLMLAAFELLREAGGRMPRSLGQSISVVGALVLGQAAVEAGLVSTPMVIVTSISALATFTVPSTDLSLGFAFNRLILLVIGGSLGLFGLTCGLIILLIHLISMRSFGEPYLSPMAPLDINKLSALFVRPPKWVKFKSSFLDKLKKTAAKAFKRV